MNRINGVTKPQQVRFNLNNNESDDRTCGSDLKLIVGLIIGIGTVILLVQAFGITYYLINQNMKNSVTLATIKSTATTATTMTSSSVGSGTNTVSSGGSSIDSLIINSAELATLKTFTNSTGFTLVYRGSRDGYTATAFHLNCDGKGKTVTIIKTSINYVFGGYTDALWDGTGVYKTDANAFLFSLRQAGFSNSQKFLINSASTGYAIMCNASSGPVFGSDIHVNDNFNGATNNLFCYYYQCTYGPYYLNGGSSTFTVDEIEVFQKL